jgi:hypothetical protein
VLDVAKWETLSPDWIARAVRTRCALAKKLCNILYKVMQMHENRTCLNSEQSFYRMLRHRPTIPRAKNA